MAKGKGAAGGRKAKAAGDITVPQIAIPEVPVYTPPSGDQYLIDLSLPVLFITLNV